MITSPLVVVVLVVLFALFVFRLPLFISFAYFLFVAPFTDNKEPNLMPVPSPQQISYLNTFEGQELTIQKQPNANINKDGTPIM